MKRLLVLVALACAAAASFGATLNPVQLLNPSGSTAGQAIVSTGASSAPAWGNVTAAALGAQAANTVVANATGASAAPTAFAMPSCNTTSSALIWTPGTGFQCSTAINASALGGTVAASYALVAGTTTNNNASAGNVGEFVSSTVAFGSAIPLTTLVNANITSISLTAGDWEVWGTIATAPAAGTVQTFTVGSISTVSATIQTQPGTGANIALPFTANTGQTIVAPVGRTRLSLAATTTVFLVIQCTFTASTNAAYGYIAARRIR